ncbi:RING-H2 finger protein ATL8-like [Cucurbita maxima]|uniref:RING-H2 finger protein ATL8-like n=1 Tax=Cucurbita maxima TaxID=3661 RepID=A0A6J1IN79_CUCMA|nr:RING-H2 finger protein ATL8-like [Cucurbita maxima]
MRPFRYLAGVNSSAISDSAEPQTYDSDFVIILAALLCALICVLGLVAVARCAWLRHLAGNVSGGASTRPPPPPPPASNKGLKKKILRSLPKYNFTAEFSAQFSDCAICLAEFAIGDEIRVLPQCGHGFHVSCIDMWFRSHSSCPSCRQILVVSQCQKCGGFPASSSSNGGTESRVKEGGDGKMSRFLP